MKLEPFEELVLSLSERFGELEARAVSVYEAHQALLDMLAEKAWEPKRSSDGGSCHVVWVKCYEAVKASASDLVAGLCRITEFAPMWHQEDVSSRLCDIVHSDVRPSEATVRATRFETCCPFQASY